ncbi:THUMP domain-containing class I SAM-dependent RNA methyltransferase [Brachymonas denitrificans]|uniref:THUMP domain-containing class I SAM-dependent RNA methyltransferase n=1 Tax=Brachymonas denitrificans TaxID=28220 RepID=UPI001BCC8EB8|nr:THUMP domain-containing protein [Brachymonas denitrificans]
MNALHLFLPCAAGVEGYLADEVAAITALPPGQIQALRAGVLVHGSWRNALQLNLHSRLAQRVLVQLSRTPYQNEADLYEAASAIAWEMWFTPQQTFRIDITAQRSPLKSLNFAALRIKDAVADRFRARAGSRPSVDTQWPHVRIFAHLTNDRMALYIDTSGEPLFKRGWREDKGDAPLKETLAAAMIAASGWRPETGQPLYDPCCGSGTIVVEAAQMACRMAPGAQRRFGFERLLPFQAHVWQQLRQEARAAELRDGPLLVFGSDVAHRMVDFAQRNAQRAGVAHAVQLRGGDALQRMPPTDAPGILLVNPPYGERIAAAGVAGQRAEERARSAPRVHRVGGTLGTGTLREAAASRGGRESAIMAAGSEDDDFFARLASHWKKHYTGWTAWMLTPDRDLPRRMRLKETRKIPMWNGPIECRLFRFDLVAGSMQTRAPRDASAGDATVTGPGGAGQ